MTRFRALLASLRIANAPSVVSNVWLGYMLGFGFYGIEGDPFRDLSRLITVGLCLFFAGNLLNDWHDREWDKEHRPERALPSGRFSPTSYLAGAVFLILNALISAATISFATLNTAIGILTMIIVYTALHKRTPWAVIPMGLCRAGLYALGFTAPHFLTYQEELPITESVTSKVHIDNSIALLFIATHAFGIFIYIVGLSLTARSESNQEPDPRSIMFSRIALVLAFLAMAGWWVPHHPLAVLIGVIPLGVWLWLALTRYRQPISALVSAFLAGIPLVDFIAAFSLAGSTLINGTSVLVPDRSLLYLTTIALPLIAFLLGRLLQRVAPAT